MFEKTQQKLSGELKNIPTDASIVCSSINSGLNREETLSVQNKVLPDNILEENQRQHTDGLKVIVYVLNKDGIPLMPCKPAKARHLLEQKKAMVVSRKPFTIRLLWDCECNIQPIKLGIDSGYEMVGFSATTSKRELLSGKLKLRTNISKLLEQRRNYRRGRRYRLWHREPRFDNRGTVGWLAPSIHHKLDSHIRLVEEIKKLLPITDIAVEVASFDIQKIKNPDIQGKDYQNGVLRGFWNVREYVLHRDNHLCQHCKGKSKDKILQVHHVHGKKEGATNRPEEFLTVCKTCHDNHHKEIDIIPDKEIHRFKPETFMTMVRWKIVNQLKEMYGDIVHHTYGHITKSNRISIGIEKSHVNDAFVIAGGSIGIQRCVPYDFKQVRRNNRSIQLNRKGFKPSIRRQRYALQPNDLVRYNNKLWRVKGVHCYGKYVVLANKLMEKADVAFKKVELIKYGKGIFA